MHISYMLSLTTRARYLSLSSALKFSPLLRLICAGSVVIISSFIFCAQSCENESRGGENLIICYCITPLFMIYLFYYDEKLSAGITAGMKIRERKDRDEENHRQRTI